MTEIRTAKVPGGEFPYFSFGTGEKTLLVLPGLSIQSVMGSAEAIREAFGLFTGDYTVYMVEHRTSVPEDFTLSMMAGDVAAFLKEQKISSADVFGLSMGGMVAQCLALDHPELVNRLVLGSTAPRLSPAAQKVIGRWIDLAREKDAAGLCRSFADLVYSPSFRKVVEPAVQAMAQTVTEEELGQFLRTARAIPSFDVSSRLSGLTCPTLVLGAKEDRVLFPEASEELAGLTHAQLYFYEGYGHAAYDEAPDYRSRVLTFLQK